MYPPNDCLICLHKFVIFSLISTQPAVYTVVILNKSFWSGLVSSGSVLLIGLVNSQLRTIEARVWMCSFSLGLRDVLTRIKFVLVMFSFLLVLTKLWHCNFIANDVIVSTVFILSLTMFSFSKFIKSIMMIASKDNIWLFRQIKEYEKNIVT